MPGAPHPRFPVEFRGFHELHAPLLKERRTRGLLQSCVQEIRGISLVFREMWDTAALALKPVTGPTTPYGALRSHQRTWAEKDGRSPYERLSLKTLPFVSSSKRPVDVDLNTFKNKLQK